jgi:4-amino-4-deoxychorismate lyase
VTVLLLAVLGQGLVDPTQPVVLADDLGFTRGDGCFEGCRLQTTADGRSVIDKLEAHLERMAGSAHALGLPFDAPRWRELVDLVCAHWAQPGETAVKLMLSRGTPEHGPLGLVSVSALPADYPRQRREGARVITLTRGVTADSYTEPWLLGGVKTLAYAVNMAAQREAQRLGVDDAVFVSTDGYVLEAPTSSVVWSVGRTLHTPPAGPSGILASTTQRLLFDRAPTAGWETSYTAGQVADLHAADVVWLIGTVRGPVDIVVLDGRARPRRPDLDAEIRALCGFPNASGQLR